MIGAGAFRADAQQAARIHACDGAAAGTDELLLEETDERFHLTLHKSRSKQYLFLELDSAATSDWMSPASPPRGRCRASP